MMEKQNTSLRRARKAPSCIRENKIQTLIVGPVNGKTAQRQRSPFSVGVEETKCEYLDGSLPYRLPNVLLSLISLAGAH